MKYDVLSGRGVFNEVVFQGSLEATVEKCD